jgi:urease accessory protein
VFLPRGTVVRGGDVLVAEDGSLVRVLAAPQPVLVITACTQHGTAFDLTRAAYHLGNRHVPIELQPDHLKIEPDHVLADMLRAMHLIVTEVRAAFEPEGGAYAARRARQGTHAMVTITTMAMKSATGHEQTAPSMPRGTIHAPMPTTHVHGPGCGHHHWMTPAPAPAPACCS